MANVDRLSGNLQESEFRNQGELYFDREFRELLKELHCTDEEMSAVKSIVVDKYMEMRRAGFSEYITLSELENLSTNTKINEINAIKKEYTQKILEKIEKNMRIFVNGILKYEVDKFEKTYGSEWMYVVSNESELIDCLLKILEDGIKKEKCMEMIGNENSEYKKEYYKLIADSINVSRKNAESYFHVLMEILRINKDSNHIEEKLKNSGGFFSKSIVEKVHFISSVVEKLNRIKHLESLSRDNSISISERELIKEFYAEQKKSLSDFLVLSKNVNEYSPGNENLSSQFSRGLSESDQGATYSINAPVASPHLNKASNNISSKDIPKNNSFMRSMMIRVKDNFKILSKPFYELASGIKELYISQASNGEKWFRIGAVFVAFIGFFASLIAFVFFSPDGSLFYEDPILKVPVVLAFYWASAKVSSEIFDWTSVLYRAYERRVYGVEGHVEYILTEKAKSYFREIELEEMRNYFVREISTYQKRLNKIKNKESEEFNIESNVIKQLGLAWAIIQSGGIDRDRVKTVKAVQLCLREIYKIRSNEYHNQFWRYDDSNTYNVLGVFMQNVRHAEAVDKKEDKSKPKK